MLHLKLQRNIAKNIYFSSFCPFIQETGSGLVLSRVQNMTENLPSLLTSANSLLSLHQQSGSSLTNVPSSQSCQHINKTRFNDPLHHICLCVGVYHVAVWQSQLLKSDPPVTWKEPYSHCLTLLSALCVRVCVRDKERVILFNIEWPN